MAANVQNLGDVTSYLDTLFADKVATRSLREWEIERRIYDGKPAVTLRWLRQDDVRCNITVLVASDMPPFDDVRVSANVWKDELVSRSGVERRRWRSLVDRRFSLDKVDVVVDRTLAEAENIQPDKEEFLPPYPSAYAPM